MSRQSAFTLMEVMMVLTIISILSLIAVPGLQEVMRRAQDDAVRSDLTRILEIACNEAGMRNKTVTLCRSRDLLRCGGDWSDGQIVFVDNYHDDVVHDKSQIIAVNKMKISRGVLHARFYPFYRQAIHFNSAVAVSNDNGSFWYCRAGAAFPVWALKVNRAGSVSVTLPDANGDIIDTHGKPFPC